MKILIVDDDLMVIESCRRILEEEGIHIRAATSVEEGMKILEAEDFDVMITDIKMPGEDGFKLIEKAKALKPGMPILMMTGYLTIETVAKGSNVGADNYIAKPFTPEELIAAVRKTRPGSTP